MWIVYENTEVGKRPYNHTPLPLGDATNLKDKLNFMEYWSVRHDNVEFVGKWHIMEVSKFEQQENKK